MSNSESSFDEEEGVEMLRFLHVALYFNYMKTFSARQNELLDEVAAPTQDETQQALSDYSEISLASDDGSDSSMSEDGDNSAHAFTCLTCGEQTLYSSWPTADYPMSLCLSRQCLIQLLREERRAGNNNQQ